MDAEQLVRRAYDEAWNRGDLDALTALASEDVVIRPSGKIVDLEHEYRGHAGVRRFWEDVRAPWEELAIDVERVIDLGETVVVLFRFRAKGRDGLEVDAKFGQVGTLHDGLVTSITAYGDWSEAAEAAGVEL
jgi:ketosteroid isomerase-like protein